MECKMANAEPNKDHLYGRYQQHEDWRDGLHRRVAHKSLDIPELEDVHVNNSRTGLGWKELLAVGAIVAGVPWAASLLHIGEKASSQPEIQNPSFPADSEYEVLFFDKDGNRINVPHISTKGKLKFEDLEGTAQ